VVLQDLLQNSDLHPRFRSALGHLLAVIDGVTKMFFPALPVSTLAQLGITAETVSWQGRIHSAEEEQILLDNGQAGDAEFTATIEALLQALEANTVTCEITIAPRPQQLPAILQPKLIYSTKLLRFAGPMAYEEGRQLQESFSEPIDKNAVQRLYNASATSGLRDRFLKIRARRGGARPGEMQELTSRPL
jgi:hypothetical protein